MQHAQALHGYFALYLNSQTMFLDTAPLLLGRGLFSEKISAAVSKLDFRYKKCTWQKQVVIHAYVLA